MWTPRRIFLLVLGLFFCGGAYTVYAHFLGWVDGLPPLPAAYREVMPPDVAPVIPFVEGEGNPTIRRIADAFGRNSEEVHYPIKLDSRAKGLLVLAGEFHLEPDGRAQLTPCSVAIFGKARGANGTQDISTVHCDRAFIEFDMPVRKISEMDGRKIVAAELRSDPELRSNDARKGSIHLRNNRRSVDPGDGIFMRTAGPIFYKETPAEGRPEVMTDAVIELTDHQNLPRPVGPDAPALPPTVTASGMKIFLAKEPEPKTPDKKAVAPKQVLAKELAPKLPTLPRPEKKSAGGIAGVDRVELNANVTMNLWIEPGNAFPGGTAKAKPVAPKPGTPPPEKSLVQIHTDGPFRYEVDTDIARFDQAPQADPSIPNYVQVTRQTREGRDMLTCDHLELHFIRKKPNAPVAKGPPAPVVTATPQPSPAQRKPENDMDIKSVHAWGKSIVLSSDGEDLTAWGYDLVHDALLKQTVLLGEPMIAVKEGNQIRAREMILVGTEDRGSQQARVKGPGQIDLGQLDPVTRKHVFTRQAIWQDWLVFSRVKEQGRELDVLTLTGGARFTDTPNDQMLSARQLKVWLLPKEEPKVDAKAPLVKAPAAALPAPKKVDRTQQARPHRLEATGQVVAHSLELDVQNAEYLNVWFREAPPRSVPPVPKGLRPPLPTDPAPKPMPAVIAKVDPKELKPMPKLAEAPAKKKQPIRINARRIETWVLVANGKNELERAHCEEQVAVHQDPSGENERGIDIAGHTVDVEHHPDGDILVVNGHPDKTSGEVHFDKLTLIADDITVDQRNNMALVKGAGSMRMLAGSTLQGERLAKPTNVTVYWKDGMEFRGAEKWARFEGGVQAEQQTARVLCETMQVMLDREVWMNQLQKPKPVAKDPKLPKDDRSPKVEFVVCDQQPREGGDPKRVLQPVVFTDQVRSGGQIVRSQQIESRELNMDNVLSDVIAPGPGIVRVYQLGSKDPLGGDPAAPKAKDAKPVAKKGDDFEMKLTVVKYRGRMKANNKTRTAVFYDTIDVVHMPAKAPDEKFDPNKLPPGAMRLRCETSLEVFTKKLVGPDGKERNAQNLTARGNVKVESEDFSGTAESVKYEEEKETVIFEGSRDNPAVLYKSEGQGLPPKRFKAVKIVYNKRTKSFETDQQLGVQAN